MDLYLRTKKDLNNELHYGQPEFFWGQGENDLIVGSNGDFMTTAGTDNLSQGIAKILVTERGHNAFYSAYGSILQSFIGANLDVDYLRAKIKTDLIDTLRIYQFINKDGANLNEQIDTLKSLRIDLQGDRGIAVSFSVVTRSGKTVGSLVSLEG